MFLAYVSLCSWICVRLVWRIFIPVKIMVLTRVSAATMVTKDFRPQRYSHHHKFIQWGPRRVFITAPVQFKWGETNILPWVSFKATFQISNVLQIQTCLFRSNYTQKKILFIGAAFYYSSITVYILWFISLEGCTM